MDSIYKNLTLMEAKQLTEQLKDNKEYATLIKDLEYFINLQDEKITSAVLYELSDLMTKIKKLLELDSKIKEKEDMVKLFEEISLYFKEQEIRKEDIDKILNGELFKIVEEIEHINGKEEKELDLIFITRKGANEYKKEHKSEYEGNLKIKVIDNKDKLLERILRLIERNY